MLSSTDDFVRYSNIAIAGLLESHHQSLSKKHIHTKQSLVSIIKQDVDKIVQGLLAVKNKSADDVLRMFFSTAPEVAEQISPKVQKNAIYHVGFEVYEPLDLILQGIDYWTHQASLSLGTSMQIKKYQRFPASQAFQDRVNAYTEIMRIWIEVDGQDLMLELFDIHRPVPFSASGKRLYRNFDPVITIEQQLSEHDTQLNKLFRHDDVSHYALFVESPKQVTRLHDLLASFVSDKPNFILPYPSVVINQHDKSIHTKIINHEKALEIEIVSEV